MNTKINDYEITAEYISPADLEIDASFETSQNWYDQHVRSSQYLLQIVKCSDVSCCGERRSSIFQFLDQFSPPPISMLKIIY